MKTKLLKRVRKDYEIYYNEQGIRYSGEFFNSKFLVHCKSHSYRDEVFETLNACKAYILRRVRKDYYKYSKKYNTNTKIWHL